MVMLRQAVLTLGFMAIGCVEWGSTATVGTLTDDTSVGDGASPVEPSDPSDPTPDPTDTPSEPSVAFSEEQCEFYVASEERGDGSAESWSHATPYLRQAMDAGHSNYLAGRCEQVLVNVGAGLFFPHPSDRTKSFPIFGGLTVRGGCLEDEANTSDPAAVLTILAGGMGGGGPQSYHVLRGSGTGSDEVRIDGVTIQEGQADGENEDARGAGIFAEQLIVNLSDVIVRDNYALERGGGLFLDGGQLVEGRVEWLENSTAGFGGALFASSARAYPYFATYVGNSALRGGAVYIQNTLDWFFQRTDFQDNDATLGGAIYAEAGEEVKVCRTKILGNRATRGGALYLERVSEVSVASTVFTHNQASEGASLYTQDIGVLDLSQLTLFENSDAGFANVVVKGVQAWTIHNSVLWRNGTELESDILPALEYNLLDDSLGTQGTNLSEDPRFLAPYSEAPESWDLGVRADSALIDAGNDALIRTDFCNQDVDAGTRSVGGAVDIGAYEYTP